MHRFVAVTSLTGLLLTACWVPKETGKVMQDDINALKGDVTALRRDLDAARAQEAEHTSASLKKVEELSTALGEFNHSARMTDADFGAQMDRILHDVQELRGAVEVNEHRIGETETKLEETLAKKLADLHKQDGNEGGETSASAEGAMPKDKKDALAYAVRLAKDNKLNDARAVFRAIVKNWPKEPGTTDEALVRLGETYAEEKKYEAALHEYVKVVEKFSTGSWVDDAYYKIGLCSLELGRLDDAQTFFNEVVTNHRKSPLAKAARAKLDETNRRLEAARKAGKKR